MKKLFFILFAFFLVILISSFFYFRVKEKSNSKDSSALIYNQFTEKWERTSKITDESLVETTIIKDSNYNADGLHNESVLRGYFDRYDQETGLLYIKYKLPLSSSYEIAQLKTSLSQNAYCAPSQITDQRTGQIRDIKEINFMVKNGATLQTHAEKPLSFDDFLAKATDQTYLFVQLTDVFATEKQNYIYKLIAIGLCE